MNVETIWENGVFRPGSAINQEHRVTIQVPDEERVNVTNPYNLPREVLDQAQAMLAKMEAIRNAPMPPDDGLNAITSKQLERIEAFALR
ncbi:MAG: hypothetical protein Q7J38_04650 [Gallionella sp.]|nr:hypothetical protein [Gallionella sp.]